MSKNEKATIIHYYYETIIQTGITYNKIPL